VLYILIGCNKPFTKEVLNFVTYSQHCLHFLLLPVKSNNYVTAVDGKGIYTRFQGVTMHYTETPVFLHICCGVLLYVCLIVLWHWPSVQPCVGCHFQFPENNLRVSLQLK